MIILITLENSVIQDSCGNAVYAYSAFTKRCGENVESEIISNENKEALQQLNIENQSNIGFFRDNLLYTPKSEHVLTVNNLFATKEQSSNIVNEVCSLIKEYESLQENGETQEN